MLSLGAVCTLVAIILFVVAALPVARDYRLELIGLAFFAAGHLL